MKTSLIQQTEQLNPWLSNPNATILTLANYRNRVQETTLLSSSWDNLCTLLTGPRRAGKTTLGKYLCQTWLAENRFQRLLYLNCDYLEIRDWLQTPYFIEEAQQHWSLQKPIIFIDEMQRLENPGLLLKSVIDLNKPIKWLASGSLQLELKSKVQEHLTGRQFTGLVLPLSFAEWDANKHLSNLLRYGAYPQIIATDQKELLLGQVYENYIRKDIIEILKVGKPDIFQKLIVLLAHSAGQLMNYTQLCNDCQISMTLLKNYLEILEQTYVIKAIKPFVGNKRSEITSNPIYYFIDNGFRNYALHNFNDLDQRIDSGLLVDNLIFQELIKFNTQNFLNYSIYYWRTKAGAEVDFVLYKNQDAILPIEVKYRNLQKPMISRGYRSFLHTYQPKQAVMITKNFSAKTIIENTEVFFIPLEYLAELWSLISAL